MSDGEQERGSHAFIEAVAAGVPAVATEVGNVNELENRFGPMFERVPQKASGEELAAAVERAIERFDQGPRARAQAAVWQHFSASRMARDWETFLVSIGQMQRD